MSDYFTISKPAAGSFKDRGSKFLAFAYPVSNEEEFKSRLSQLKSEYHDARHHCSAFIVGMDQQMERASDDGEPNHSAGDPILGQIKSHGLTNCAVIVVRYFGGTKLGVSGLINAYKTAAHEALQSAHKKTIFPQYKFNLTFDYSVTSQVERILSEYEIQYLEKNYTDICQFRGKIRSEHFDSLNESLGLVEKAALSLIKG